MPDDVVATYWPYVDEPGLLIGEEYDVQYLAVGPTVSDVIDKVTGLWWTEAEHTLPEGFYVFHLEAGTRVVEVTRGEEPQAVAIEATLVDLEAPDHPLMAALSWADHLWSGATAVPAPKFAVRDDVIVHPAMLDGIVRGRTCRRGTWSYTVHTDGKDIHIGADRLSTPEVGLDPLEWVKKQPQPAEDVAATLTQRKLQASLTSTVFSFRTTRTTFRPYQFKPVLKLLQSGSTRMLIADEVGLGKTIEAGLIWTELEARHRADRVLVLCPSNLVQKWQREMEDRFGFELTVLDKAGLDKSVADLREGKPQGRCKWICTIERLRSWERLPDAVDLGLTFDLVLVDEAHAMRNSISKSYRMGSALDSLSDAIVFLSATPLNLGNADLFNLLQLLKPGEYPSLNVLEERLIPNHYLQRIAGSLTTTVSQAERRAWFAQVAETRFGRSMAGRPEYRTLRALLDRPNLDAEGAALVRRQIAGLHTLSTVLTRTRKADIQESKTVREPHNVVVTLDPREEEFITRFESWCEDRAKAAAAPVRFAAQMPLRLLGSCIPAAAAQLLDADPAFEDLDATPSSPITATLVPPDAALIAAARSVAGIDSKYDQLVRSLRTVISEGRQVLLFTFSLRTIGYLQRRLRNDGFRTGVLHGKIAQADRHPVMKQFRDGDFDILVANRVASEGLDFEFCTVVVNYDLPWNPMEIEQRIGRIDRIGQTSPKVYVFRFDVPGTIETDILARVMDRIGVFERSIGELDPIVASEFKKLEKIALDFKLSAEQRRKRADEVAIAASERQMAREEVRHASDATLSGDYEDIEGLEEDLLGTGRYVGPAELATLVRRWARAQGGTCNQDEGVLSLKGNIALAERVEALVRSRTRTRAEIDTVARQLRAEQTIYLSLDWDATRVGGLDLLTPTHPLVLAAATNPQHRQARFGAVRVDAQPGAPAGCYLIFVVEATWRGQRPAHELWPVVIEARSARPVTGGVVSALWSALASGAYADAVQALPGAPELRRLLRRAVDEMRDRQDREERLRTDENEAFTKIRLESYELEHEHRMAEIDKRLASAHEGAPEPFAVSRRLFEGQRAKALRDIEERRVQVAKGSECHLDVEDVACVWLEVS